MELSNHLNPGQEGTFHVKITKWRPALKVTADGKGVATHAGSRLLAEMADRSGLTDALSEALAPMCKRRRRHDPGKVISDLAVTIAGGGGCPGESARPAPAGRCLRCRGLGPHRVPGDRCHRRHPARRDPPG